MTVSHVSHSTQNKVAEMTKRCTPSQLIPWMRLIPQDMFASSGNQVKKTTKIHMQRSLKWNLVKKQKEQSPIRASEKQIRFLMTWSLLHMPLKAVTSTLLRTISCLRQNALFKTPKRGNWWPDQVFKDCSVVCAISTTSRQWSHFCVFDSFSKQYFSKYTTSRSMSLLEMPMRHTYKYFHSSIAVRLRKMQREVFSGRPFESRLQTDSYTNNHFSQLISASDLDCCFMAILSWRKPPGPRIMREFWSNSRVRIQGNEKRRGEDSSHAKGIEVFVRETV